MRKSEIQITQPFDNVDLTILESEISKLKQEIVQYGSVCKVQEQKIS